MNWKDEKLSEVLSQNLDYVTDLGPVNYKKLSVKLYGKGVLLDGIVSGDDVKMTRHQIAKEGQVILSEIWGKKGAIGIVPEEGNGALCTSHFFLFDINTDKIEPGYLAFLCSGNYFERQLGAAAQGSTGYAATRPKTFLETSIPLPPPHEQRRFVAQLKQTQTTVAEIKRLRDEQQHELRLLLRQQFRKAIADAPREPMGQVAPIVRRPVDIDRAAIYPELGVRSFGRGTFHKPPTIGADVTWQKPCWLKSNDLLFSNIKAWEGAVAVVDPADDGRIASHRYITCEVDTTKMLPHFLLYYLLTPEGIEKINQASPGTADRNRTLGTGALNKIQVPVPHPDIQRTFLALHSRIHQLIDTQHAAQADLDLLLPSALDKAFRGEL